MPQRWTSRPRSRCPRCSPQQMHPLPNPVAGGASAANVPLRSSAMYLILLPPRRNSARASPVRPSCWAMPKSRCRPSCLSSRSKEAALPPLSPPPPWRDAMAQPSTSVRPPSPCCCTIFRTGAASVHPVCSIHRLQWLRMSSAASTLPCTVKRNCCAYRWNPL